ncbi:MAG: H-type small acid-soluble spore protein [Actinobacteria bacterium]|nr:H-type small acid-soluble spore protein [Actinomycetota bacterium]
MDYNRAREILESPDIIQVQYRGRPVWIENLDPEGKSASVSTDTETLTVSVRELNEGKG